MAVKITCIKKSNGFHENPYTAITSLGWTNDRDGKSGISTRSQMFEFLENGGVAYVVDSLGNRANLITAETNSGLKYVKTVPDETKTDNLLTLNECP